MAGIDKIYGTLAQKTEFIYWILSNGYKAGNLNPIQYIYADDMKNPDDKRVISNFPEVVDKWLLKHCPLQFITDRIKEQYGIEQG